MERHRRFSLVVVPFSCIFFVILEKVPVLEPFPT